VAQHGWEVFYSLVIAAGFAVMTAGLTWVGARQVLAGKLTIGEVLVFLGYLTQLYEPLNQLSHVGATVSDASAGARRVFELLDTPCEVTDAPGARPVASVQGQPAAHRTAADVRPSPTPPLVVRGNLSFEEVSFGYDAEHSVLRKVSFSVKAGESVALIGPSGAGKTTLLQLLPRFYDPTSGVVRVEGVDLRQLKLKDLRRQVALVPQEPLLMLATIAENIAYGRPGAAAGEIQEAARAAHAHDFIQRLPQQYNTLIGEGAARLSVGEKQRINLARAFLKDAPILVLDEPTSALDAESEELVVQSLARLMQNRTALLVAHRLSTVRGVDRVIVLENGQVTEIGSPEELLQANGYYSRVVTGRLRPA
jgi:ATP-binding cassette subfamily B protein/subfamily B ATP-binding cassette protein MsbA